MNYKIWISRAIVAFVALVVLAFIVYFAKAFFLVVLDASPTVFLTSAVFIVISFGASWALHSMWISHRDTSINEMGPVTLKTYIAECSQVFENRYGKSE